MRFVALFVVAAACSETTIDRGVCGNGVVEPGEDCDATDPRCSSCGITCTTTEDCLAYDASGGTEGFVCGPDFFCHAPSGVFELDGEVVTPLNSYRVTDVNADGVGDILSQSQTAVSVVFGDDTSGAGVLQTSSILTPAALGPATYGDLDADGKLDVLMPTADGIVAYTSPFGLPSPFPFPSLVSADMGKPLFTSPLDDGRLGIIGTLPGTDQLAYLVLDVESQGMPGQVAEAFPLCNATVAEFSNEDVTAFEVSPNHQIIAVRLRQPARLCVLSVDLVSVAPLRYEIRPVALTPTSAPASRPVLTDLRNSGCPSLVVAQGPVIVEYPPIVDAPCRLQSASRELLDLPANALPIGQAPIEPPIGPLNRLGIALTTGVYGFDPVSQQLVEVYRSQRTLQQIRAADIDGDGDTDLIASAERAVALEILYRIPPFPGYQPFLFDTESPVLDFQLGDFDGNDNIDIAYVESRTFDERLLIAFGTSDQVLPGALVGTFGHVLSLIVAQIPDSTDTFNRISDLAVLFESERGAEQSSLTLLHGSPQRAMLAFFDPREPPPDANSKFRGVVTGRFGGATGNDVIAVESTLTAVGIDPGTVVNLWLSVAAMGGELQSNQLPNVSSDMSECLPIDNDTFCVNGAHYVAWPVSETTDLVLGIDRKREIIAFEPATFVPGADAAVSRFANRMVGPTDTVVRNAQVIRLEDGSPRLLIGLGPNQDAANPRLTGAVNLCTFDRTTGPRCEDVGAVVSAFESTDVTCMDAGYTRVAAASRFAPPDSTAADLVVLCRREGGGDTLYRVAADLSRVEPMFDLGGADAIQVGDVSGDGIDDLIVVDRSFAVPVMRVYRQCNSRDVECGTISVLPGAEGP